MRYWLAQLERPDGSLQGLLARPDGGFADGETIVDPADLLIEPGHDFEGVPFVELRLAAASPGYLDIASLHKTFSDAEARDEHGKWTAGGASPATRASAVFQARVKSGWAQLPPKVQDLLASAGVKLVALRDQDDAKRLGYPTEDYLAGETFRPSEGAHPNTCVVYEYMHATVTDAAGDQKSMNLLTTNPDEVARHELMHAVDVHTEDLATAAGSYKAVAKIVIGNEAPYAAKSADTERLGYFLHDQSDTNTASSEEAFAQLAAEACAPKGYVSKFGLSAVLPESAKAVRAFLKQVGKDSLRKTFSESEARDEHGRWTAGGSVQVEVEPSASVKLNDPKIVNIVQATVDAQPEWVRQQLTERGAVKLVNISTSERSYCLLGTVAINVANVDRYTAAATTAHEIGHFVDNDRYQVGSDTGVSSEKGFKAAFSADAKEARALGAKDLGVFSVKTMKYFTSSRLEAFAELYANQQGLQTSNFNGSHPLADYFPRSRTWVAAWLDSKANK